MNFNDHNKGLYVFICLYLSCWAVLSKVVGSDWIHRQIVQNTERGCGKLAISAL